MSNSRPDLCWPPGVWVPLPCTPFQNGAQLNVAELSLARRRYFERQQQTQAQLREQEKLRALKTGWQEGLRSALPNLTDEHLRRRVQECLEHEPQDLELMKSLWVEVQERTGQKNPTERLSLLLESARPYCTAEEFQAGRAEAFAILNKSGFRAARTFATTMQPVQDPGTGDGGIGNFRSEHCLTQILL